MDGCVTIPVPEDQVQDLIARAKDYLLANGLIMRTKANPLSADEASHAPFMLLPSPVPTLCFEHGRNIQCDINLLFHKVAHDATFLWNCLHSAIKQDTFTSRLWTIAEKVREEGLTQKYELSILRSDYMMECGVSTADLVASNTPVAVDQINIKQIEINTIASSFGALCSGMVSYHKYQLDGLGLHNASNQLPANVACQGIAAAFVSAWKQYANESAVVLFVVQDVERNIYDQRLLEYATHSLQPRCQIMRRTITQLQSQATLDDEKHLFVDGKEVAVVYLRALYTPMDLKSDAAWDVRLLLERSAAIKCPSVNYQLAGTKKVQQELARPGVLESYLSDPLAVKAIRSTFAGQYSLDLGAEGDETVAMALKSPERFVLKPQREGGGNNIFGDEITKMLKTIGSTEERAAYILMDRIHPVPVKNYPVVWGRAENGQPMDMVSEFGVFGIFLGSVDGDIIVNEQKGHILRTKAVGVDEGGVATGFAAIDSPFLVSAT